MTSNIVECIDSHFVEAYELPILEFLKQVISYLFFRTIKIETY